MKKNIIILIIIGLILTYQENVYAKDTVFSLNKYQEETYNFIRNSYDNNQQQDGLIVAGNYLKEEIEQNDEVYEDYQIILGKYNKQGKLLWKYSYGKTKEDKIDDLFYTYNESGKIDGYGVCLEKTLDIGETLPDNTSNTTFLKIDLSGKLVLEKDSGIQKKERIIKISPILKEDKTLDYYIAIGTINNSSVIVKYDRELNIIWEKELNEEATTYQEIVPIWNNNQVTSFAIIKSKEENNQKQVFLMKYDLEGNAINTINDHLEQYDSYQLLESSEGFLLYGITSEVKLKKGEKSYYLIKYNTELGEEWESIGEIPIESNQKINIQKDDEKKNYYLQYINKVDSSLEVIELDEEGLFQKKIKKIQADYYDIEDFITDGEVLFFVGQINCPEDDTCDYDSNSLFLISDEDKVIEVKEEDSKNILVITIIAVIGITGIVLIRQRRKSLQK